jgi:hypothetical protein
VWLSIRPRHLILLIGALITCSPSKRAAPRESRGAAWASGRVTFNLTHLDGKRLPASYSDPRGQFTLRAGQLTLDPNGDLWFVTDLVPVPDTIGGHVYRSTFVGTYERAGPDSLVFPAHGGRTPEYFGRLDGTGGLRLVAHPLPNGSGGPSAISVAAEHGGAHVWEFHVP